MKSLNLKIIFTLMVLLGLTSTPVFSQDQASATASAGTDAPSDSEDEDEEPDCD